MGRRVRSTGLTWGAVIKEVEMDSHAHSFCDKGLGAELELPRTCTGQGAGTIPVGRGASQMPCRTLPLARFISYIDL